MSFSSPEPTKSQVDAIKRRLHRAGAPARQPTRVEAALLRGAMRKALALEPEDLRFALRLAADHMRRGDFGPAMQIYIGLVLCEPLKPDFQAGLANCALYAAEYHLALQAASALIAMEPDKFRGYYISGRACLALRRREEAEEDLQDALRLAPESGGASFVQEIQALLQKLAAFKAPS